MNTRDPDTYLRGEACYQAKLKEADVIAARKLVKDGIKVTYIAEKLGINRKTLGDAINGRTWKHLAGAAALMVGMTTAAHATPYYLMLGQGVTSCATIMDEDSNDIMDAAQVEWVEGFISGVNAVNLEATNATQDIGRGIPKVTNGVLFSAIREYCNSNPTQSLSDFAIGFYKYLRSAHN